MFHVARSYQGRVVILSAMSLTLVMVITTFVFAPPVARSRAYWYVAPGGSDGADCQTPATACATINGAIGKAGTDDLIRVAVGVYAPITTTVNVTLSGGWDPGFTQQSSRATIDGQDLYTGLKINFVNVEIDHFTIQNSTYGIENIGQLQVSNSVILSSSLNAILNETGVITITNSLISGSGGDAIRNDYGTITLNDSSVNHNVGSGLAISNASYDANNTLILNNSTVSDNAGAAIASFEPTSGQSLIFLNNSTLSGNGSGRWGGTMVMQNSIAQGCEGVVYSQGYNVIENTSGCLFLPGVGDLINVDPRLGRLVGFPGHRPLLLDSPAIDAGNPTGCQGTAGLLTTDQRGVPRSGRCDIGAYEFVPAGPPVEIFAIGGSPQHTEPLGDHFAAPLQARVIDQMGTPVNNVTVVLTAPLTGPSGIFLDTRSITTTAVTDNDGIATAAVLMANALTGTYSVTAAVGGVSAPIYYQLSNHLRWYVSPTGNTANDCASPTTACATIEQVLNKNGFLNDVVLVASGAYSSAIITRSAYVEGGWDATFTQQNGLSIIDAAAARSALIVGGDSYTGNTPIKPKVSLERFTIQNGRIGSSYGGGVYVASGANLTLSACNVISNVAYSVGAIFGYGIGGGIANRGTLTLNSSTVANNEADWGSGIYNAGYLMLNNSTVSNNYANQGGGGIVEAGTGTVLRNATVSDNHAFGGDAGGIDARGSGAVYLQNTILAGNTALGTGPDCAGQVNLLNDYALIQNTTGCLIGPQQVSPPAPPNSLLPSTIITGVSPLLGPLQYAGGPTLIRPLLVGSPAIDRGDPAMPGSGGPACEAPDQRGVARPQRGQCDLGAYEYDSSMYQTFLPLTLK